MALAERAVPRDLDGPLQRAITAGLTFRPLAATARETYDWFKTEPAERQAKLALNLERNTKLLEEWKARR